MQMKTEFTCILSANLLTGSSLTGDRQLNVLNAPEHNLHPWLTIRSSTSRCNRLTDPYKIHSLGAKSCNVSLRLTQKVAKV